MYDAHEKWQKNYYINEHMIIKIKYFVRTRADGGYYEQINLLSVLLAKGIVSLELYKTIYILLKRTVFIT